MTDTTQVPMLDRVRGTRRRVNEYLVQEMDELGAPDAMTVAQRAAGISGLEFFQPWLDAENMPPPPPIVVMLGMEWVELEPGRAVLSLEPEEWMINPIGLIHGGIIATLLDTVLSCSVHSTLPAEALYATTDLHTRYVRPMQADTGRVIATGSVIHSGRRHATAEGRVEVEATSKLVATGTAGCAIIQPGVQ
jgi:uncharacterized protein (TIGR00369 family)